MASVKEYVQSVVNAIGEVNTTLTQINAQEVPDKIRELKVQVGNKQLLGTYDGSAVEVTEAGVVDIGAMLDEGKLPLEVNVNVASVSYSASIKVNFMNVPLYFDSLSITDGTSMFSNFGNKLTEVYNIDTTNFTTLYQAFYNCYNLTSLPPLNLPNCTNAYNCFYGCSKLKKIIFEDISNLEYANGTFQNCSALETIEGFYSTNIKRLGNAFLGCILLESLPPLELANCEDISNAFYQCASLTSIHLVNANKIDSVGGAFRECTNLKTIETLNLEKIYNNIPTSTFKDCVNLENLTILNVRGNLQISDGTTWGHLLTLDSLINTIKELINMDSAKTLTMGTANLEKITSTYVKFTDTTQTSIAFNRKGDVVVCESTDEGAMLLSDYALLKNWTLA